MVKNPPAKAGDARNPRVQSLGRKGPREEGMATHSSVLAWRIPWTEDLVGYSPQSGKESDTAEATEHARMQVYNAQVKQTGERAAKGRLEKRKHLEQRNGLGMRTKREQQQQKRLCPDCWEMP